MPTSSDFCLNHASTNDTPTQIRSPRSSPESASKALSSSGGSNTAASDPLHASPQVFVCVRVCMCIYVMRRRVSKCFGYVSNVSLLSCVHSHVVRLCTAIRCFLSVPAFPQVSQDVSTFKFTVLDKGQISKEEETEEAEEARKKLPKPILKQPVSRLL